jgi:hypothetical protein
MTELKTLRVDPVGGAGAYASSVEFGSAARQKVEREGSSRLWIGWMSSVYARAALLTPASLCPKCTRAGRHLAATSENAAVDYFRCGSCGHVWVVDKSDPRRAPRDVTIDPADVKKIG